MTELKKAPLNYSTSVLLGLQRKSHVYGGTVSHSEVAARRKKGKLARAARRINR